ncbi:hypothetical protein AX16_002618 [Volvariella volvacea WC 439]|nr:hypothetical protein AX16_002618 [Volvariella volvacea WC 439]
MTDLASKRSQANSDRTTSARKRAENPVEENDTSRDQHPRKKRRRRRDKAIAAAEQKSADDSWQSGSPLMSLPLELLAEVLELTESPKDVLAVARTCRYFCKTLLGTSAVFIWRSVKQSCRPRALPDPDRRFTESSYAAFVFDGGICEICKRQSNDMYTSFSLRLRLCKDEKCWIAIRQMGLQSILVKINHSSENEHLLQYVPKLESPSCLLFNGWRLNSEVMRDETQSICRRCDWERINDEYKVSIHNDELEAFTTSHEPRIQPMKDWTEFCFKLVKWRNDRLVAREKVIKENEDFAKALAIKKGYEFWDLMNTPTYKALHKAFSDDLIKVTSLDLITRLAVTEAELVTISDNRKRRDYEQMHDETRKQVKILYGDITLNSSPNQILPALSTFRNLPIIKQLQITLSNGPKPRGGAADTIEKALTKNATTRSLVQKELEQWRAQAQEDFNEILGYKDWKSPSISRLPPSQRLTAWFICTLCTTNDKGWVREDKVLDFKGACMHECLSTKSTSHSKYHEWKVSNFVKYDKAVIIMGRLLELLGIDPEASDSRPAFSKCSTSVICRSCDPPLVIKPSSVLSHCQRHDDMKFTLYDEEDTVKVNPVPYEGGLTAQLMRQGERAKKFREMKNYICRHCPKRTDGPSKLLTIMGLRSHLLAKHNVKQLLDEDYVCKTPLNWDY